MFTKLNFKKGGGGQWVSFNTSETTFARKFLQYSAIVNCSQFQRQLNYGKGAWYDVS